MEIKEAYRVMQAEWVRINNVQVGTRVRCTREYVMNEMGSCVMGKDAVYVGQEYTVAGIYEQYIACDECGRTPYHPFFALEVIGQPENMIEIEGKKWSEATIAEALRNHAK